MQQGPQIPDFLEETTFAELPGWEHEAHGDALSSFLRFCQKPNALGSHSVPAFNADTIKPICAAAVTASKSNSEARTFLEQNFTPYRVEKVGFITGYFEPEVGASRERTDLHSTPLHAKPSGLEPVNAGNEPENWPDTLTHGRRVGGVLEELPDRGAIMDGALEQEGLELVWLENPIDAYFVHVQGSARLRLTDGSVMRVGYAGKTGHPYTGIARLLVKRGEGTPDDFTMAGLRAWLEANPDQRDDLFRQNRSYIFFREVTETSEGEGPVGAAGLALTPGRSLAVDPAFIPYGALVHVSSELADIDDQTRSFARLMTADDTGSAIRGLARGDVFVGSGTKAGAVAGDIRHRAEFTLLLPNAHLTSTGEAVE